jgi:nicotinamidase-related amidase
MRAAAGDRTAIPQGNLHRSPEDLMQPLDDTAALVVIDVQQGFDDPVWGRRNNPHAEANVARLLEAWRTAGRPVFHTRHDSVHAASPLRPGQPGNDFKAVARPRPDEPVLAKTVNSAFIGTTLEADLRTLGIGAVVLAGLVTNHCVSTTARMASNLGFRTVVVSDATATFDHVDASGRRWSAEERHEMELAVLAEEFGTVATTAELVAAAGAATPI